IFLEHGVPVCVYVVSSFMRGADWLWFDKLRFLVFSSTEDSLSLRLDDEEDSWSLSTPELREMAWNAIATRCGQLDTGGRDRIIAEVSCRLAVELPCAPPQEYAAANVAELLALDPEFVEIGGHTSNHPIL